MPIAPIPLHRTETGFVYQEGILETPVSDDIIRQSLPQTDPDRPKIDYENENAEGLVYLKNNKFHYILPPQRVTLKDHYNQPIDHITPHLQVVGQLGNDYTFTHEYLQFGWVQDGVDLPFPYSNTFERDNYVLDPNRIVHNTNRICWGSTYLPAQQNTLSHIPNLVRSLLLGIPNDDLDHALGQRLEIQLQKADREAVDDLYQLLRPNDPDALRHAFECLIEDIDQQIADGDISLRYRDHRYGYRIPQFFYKALSGRLQESDDPFALAESFWDIIYQIVSV